MTEKTPRILGYDFARALAIFGMVIVNFKIVMCTSNSSGWLISAIGILEGRAAAIFVILAGVGISLMTAKTRAGISSRSMSQHRTSLLKRAFLLVVLGLCYSPIWPADILHFYGFYIALGVVFLTADDRILVLNSVLLNMGFIILLLLFDYESGWDWETMTYTNFWTMSGMVRHIFYNGFHPVFPWASFLLMGMWMGRQDMASILFRRKMVIGSFISWGIIELASSQALIYFMQYPHGISLDDIQSLFGTGPMPPMPQYIISAGSSAVIIICLSISIASKYPSAKWVGLLCQTGRISLTLYVAHVVMGMGFLELIGRIENQTIEFALFSAMFFNVLCIAFAHFWSLKFKTGPIEELFRKLAR